MSSPKPCYLLGKPTTKTTNNAISRYTAGNETAPSTHTKKETVTTDAAKSTKLKPSHSTKEPGALRIY